MRFSLISICLLTCFISFFPNAYAENVESVEVEAEVEGVSEFTSKFVVRVLNHVSNVFSPEVNGGHGTGFVVEIDKETGEGTVFTNRHVIESSVLDAQDVQLEFSTDTDIPEAVSAKIVYVSGVHDFAVLKFKLSSLSRVRDKIVEALLPIEAEELYDFQANYRKLQGREVFALGNPFDSSNISTFGQISGMSTDPFDGYFIQTQTPINPGNSGGPLIDIETGAVLGMNTMIIEGANNIGFSIPIKDLWEEYTLWKEQPDIVIRKELLLGLQLAPKSNLDSLGLTSIIENEVPDYFYHHTNMIQVRDAHPSTGFLSGDHIISMDGYVPGGSVFEYRKFLSFNRFKDDVIHFKVIRDGRVISVESKIRPNPFTQIKRDLNFIYMSGLILRETSKVEAWSSDKTLKSQVTVDFIDESQEVMFGASSYPAIGSYIIGITIENKFYKIRNLATLKNILNQNSGSEVAVLHVRNAIMVNTEQGYMPMQTSQGTSLLDSIVTTFVIPMHRIVTPIQFSLNKFKQQFKFGNNGYSTRDWTQFIKADRAPSTLRSCEKALTGKEV